MENLNLYEGKVEGVQINRFRFFFLYLYISLKKKKSSQPLRFSWLKSTADFQITQRSHENEKHLNWSVISMSAVNCKQDDLAVYYFT